MPILVLLWGSGKGEIGSGPGGREDAGERGGATAVGDDEGRVDGEEWTGQGVKRRREGWEVGESEGRQVRTRTDRRGGRKRKKGDG